MAGNAGAGGKGPGAFGRLVDRLRRHARVAGAGAAVAALAFLLGYVTGGGGARGPREDEVAAEAAPLFWSCPMHPQIQKPGPGQCPICGMDLVPIHEERGEAPLGAREIRLSETARRLAEVRVSPVERRFVEAEVRMVGKVDYDETRLAEITAWVGGRLDRLYVDYTGIRVKKGDHMVLLYSPAILSAQEELIQATAAARELEASAVESMRRTARKTVEAVREKLRLWGLTPEQVKEIEERGTASDRILIYAPAGGVVVEKHAVEGAYVTTGTRIYTIADLSRVWVKLDAYEADLAWVRYGQRVEFTSDASPGETFEGRIAFVDPILDARTRTVKLRVNVPNPDGRLKPGMFVRGIVRAKVAEGGKVAAPELAGKWISPMHPEVVKDSPGTCDVCGMPLESAESLGYVPAEKSKAPLVIPATAPLVTGRRAVVYVASPDRDGVYEGREVVLGARAGDWYVVSEGLAEGELVVTNGNFKIDSAMQIMAKPSMMSPEGGAAPPAHHGHGGGPGPGPGAEAPTVPTVPKEFSAQLDRVLEGYLATQLALAADDLRAATDAAKDFLRALGKVDMLLLSGPAHGEWMKVLAALRPGAEALARAGDIDSAREVFSPLSNTMIDAVKRFGTIAGRAVHRYHCPLAFDNRGADWLSAKEEVRNPYFGARMPACGTHVETIGEGDGARPAPGRGDQGR